MVVNIRCFLGPHPQPHEALVQECMWGTGGRGSCWGSCPRCVFWDGGLCVDMHWGERLRGEQDAAKMQSHHSLVGTSGSSGPGQTGVLVPGRW